MRVFKKFKITALITSIFFTGTAVSANDQIIVFDWGGYEDPAFFTAYVDKYGTSPEYSFFSDEEEAFQKVRAGFKADLGHPCSQSIVKWRNAGIIEPIDTKLNVCRATTFANKKVATPPKPSAIDFIVPLT